MDIANNPFVVIVSTVSGVLSVAAATLGTLTYIRRRWVGPVVRGIRNVMIAAEAVPSIRAQLFNNGGSTLKDAVDQVKARIASLHEQFDVLMEEHELAMFRCDMSGKYLWVNRRYCRQLDITEAEALGGAWRNHIHPEDIAGYTRSCEHAFKERRPLVTQVRLLASNESELVFKVRAYPLADGSGYMGFLDPVKVEVRPLFGGLMGR